MAIENKYGKIDVPGIPDNEPIFIFRAQDMLAIPILSSFKRLVEDTLSGRDPFEHDKMVHNLGITLRNFIAWPKKKIPG